MTFGLLMGLAFVLSPKVATAAPTSTPPTLTQQIDTLAGQYGVSAALASRIIYCESKDLQSARRVNTHSTDVGLFQINTKYQGASALKRGDDIYTESGNLDYGFWLLSVQGTTPWNWSKGCWSNLTSSKK